MSRVPGSRLKILSKPTAAERARERRKLGNLESQLVQAKTRARYKESFISLCRFLGEREKICSLRLGSF